MANGEVVISAYNCSVGNYTMTDHGSGVGTVYMHNPKLLTGVGEEMTKGQVITKVGSAGYSTGLHLHFGTRSKDIHASPRSYVNS